LVAAIILATPGFGALVSARKGTDIMSTKIGKWVSLGALGLSMMACQGATEPPTSAATGRITAGAKSQALGIAQYEMLNTEGQTVVAGYGSDGSLVGLISVSKVAEKDAVLSVGYGGELLTARIADKGELFYNGQPIASDQVATFGSNLALLQAAEEELDIPSLGFFANGEVPNSWEIEVCIGIGIARVCVKYRSP
jgi:hypothetical protein